jgi:hypothetical protein
MAKKKFNIGMAALGALAAGMGGKYIYDKFGNKSPVAKKAAAAKADASSKPASEDDTLSASRNTSPSGMAAGMKAERSVPVPDTPAMSPAPTQAQSLNSPSGMGAAMAAERSVPTDYSPTDVAASNNSPSGRAAGIAAEESVYYKNGGMVARKASKSAPSNKGLSVRGGGKATKGLGKVRMF